MKEFKNSVQMKHLKTVLVGVAFSTIKKGKGWLNFEK